MYTNIYEINFEIVDIRREARRIKAETQKEAEEKFKKEIRGRHKKIQNITIDMYKKNVRI